MVMIDMVIIDDKNLAAKVSLSLCPSCLLIITKSLPKLPPYNQPHSGSAPQFNMANLESMMSSGIMAGNIPNIPGMLAAGSTFPGVSLPSNGTNNFNNSPAKVS